MTASNFEACLAIILESEGGGDGVTVLPNDPGGATKWGITIGTYSQVQGHPCTVDDLRAMTTDERDAIYRATFWNKCGGDQLPSGVDLMVFDGAVNMGVSRSVKQLQGAVGVAADGVIGPATLGAVAGSGSLETINAIAVAREHFYEGLPTFPSFGKGWLNRVARTETLAQAMVTS